MKRRTRLSRRGNFIVGLLIIILILLISWVTDAKGYTTAGEVVSFRDGVKSIFATK